MPPPRLAASAAPGSSARRRLVESRAASIGRPPGGLPASTGAASQISAFTYTPGTVAEHPAISVGDACRLAGHGGVTWINVDGVADTVTLAALGEAFGIHPLAVEDIAHTNQRPKLEVYGEQVFIVVQMVGGPGNPDRASEQIAFVLGPDYVLSFQERPGDVFGPVRDRLRTGAGRVRQAGPDYLLYSLLDLVVDGLFTVLEDLGDVIESLEDRVLEDPTVKLQAEIGALRREAVLMRRAVWPLREVLAALQRDDVPHVVANTRVYLRDVYDHLIQAVDVIESLRDVLAALFDLYLSAVSTRQNEVMKALTVIGAVFLPLTFLTGLYGMNFDDMPELHARLGYPILLVTMAVVTIGTLLYFRRRGWL